MAKPTKKTPLPNVSQTEKAQNSEQSGNISNNPTKEDLKDVLLKLIEIHYLHIGQYQNQRSVISNILVISCAAILAFIAFDKAIDNLDYPLIGVLMFQGIFGMVISWKYYERTEMLHKMYEAYRDKLSENLLELGTLKNLEETAINKHEGKYWFSKYQIWEWLRVSSLWILFHFIIFGVGFLLFVEANRNSNNKATQPNPTATQPSNTFTPSPTTTLTLSPMATITQSPTVQNTTNSNQTTPNSNVIPNRKISNINRSR